MRKSQKNIFADTSNRSLVILFLMALVLTALVYSLGLPGDFEFDDGVNLLNNSGFLFKERDFDNVIRAALSSDSGPFRRPVSMFSFALNQYATGMDPLYFKVTNIAIHLLNVTLVYWLVGLIVRSKAMGFCDRRYNRWVSLIVASLWALHPINLTAVLYIVQRMTGLSVTFMLLAMGFYLSARNDFNRMSYKSAVAKFICVVVAGVLGVFSKESALLLPLYLLLLEYFCLGFAGREGRKDSWIRKGYVLFLMVPVLCILVYVLFNPLLVTGGYAARPFSFLERVLTEPRVLWFYVGQILMPNIQSLGLYHDDYNVSHGLFDPISTLFSIVAWAILLLSAYFLRSKKRYFAFGVLWFCVGHILESTVFPLELIHEHRNYLPSIGVIFLIVFVLKDFFRDSDNILLRFVFPSLVITLAVATSARAAQWQNLTDHAISEAINHPNSTRANFQLARVYSKWMAMEGVHPYYEKAKEYFTRSINVDKEGRNGGYFGLIHLAAQAGEPIDPYVVESLISRLPASASIGADYAFLGALANCQINLACNLDDRDFFRIANAYLSNKRLGGSLKSAVYSLMGVYSVNKLKDYKLAESYFLKAVELFDSSQRWLELGEFYRVNGDILKSKEMMRRALRSPDANVYEYDIRRSLDHLDKYEKEMYVGR